MTVTDEMVRCVLERIRSAADAEAGGVILRELADSILAPRGVDVGREEERKAWETAFAARIREESDEVEGMSLVVSFAQAVVEEAIAISRQRLSRAEVLRRLREGTLEEATILMDETVETTFTRGFEVGLQAGVDAKVVMLTHEQQPAQPSYISTRPPRKNRHN